MTYPGISSHHLYWVSIDCLPRKVSTLPFPQKGTVQKRIGWPLLDEKKLVCAGGVQTAFHMRRRGHKWVPVALSMVNVKEVTLKASEPWYYAVPKEPRKRKSTGEGAEGENDKNPGASLATEQNAGESEQNPRDDADKQEDGDKDEKDID